ARLAPVDYYRAAARVRRRQAGKIGAGTSFEENRTLRADHIVQVAAPRPRGQAPRPRDDEFIAVFEANDRRPRIDSSCVRAKRHATGHHLRGLAERVTGKVVVVDGPVEERAVSLALLHEPAFSQTQGAYRADHGRPANGPRPYQLAHLQPVLRKAAALRDHEHDAGPTGRLVHSAGRCDV